jgi:hypothetical protein
VFLGALRFGRSRRGARPDVELAIAPFELVLVGVGQRVNELGEVRKGRQRANSHSQPGFRSKPPVGCRGNSRRRDLTERFEAGGAPRMIDDRASREPTRRRQAAEPDMLARGEGEVERARLNDPMPF